MERKLTMTMLVFFFSLLTALVVHGQGGTVTPPAGYCTGGVAWPVPPHSEIPNENPCPNVSGNHVVDVGGELNTHPSWQLAYNDYYARGWDTGATFWFEPMQGGTNVIFLPILFSGPMQPPAGYCTGGVAWPVPPHSEIPNENPCPNVSGNHVVDVGGELNTHPSWQLAYNDYYARGWDTGATFWFEPSS